MRVITREKKRGLDTQIQQIINKRTKKYVEDADDPPQQTAAIFGSGRQLFQQKSIKSTKQSLRNVEIFIGMPRAGAPTFQIHFHEKKIKIKTSPPGGTRIQLIRFFFFIKMPNDEKMNQIPWKFSAAKSQGPRRPHGKVVGDNRQIIPANYHSGDTPINQRSQIATRLTNFNHFKIL